MINEKLDLQTPNLVNQNIEKIAALFPNCVTETADGTAIDFDLLRQELSPEIIEGTKERYRLEWPGKREAIVTANLPTTNTLRPVPEESVDFENTENLYIEGDNLEVLKLLQESYLGKIKMIYIDPPYNTGNDFVYNDNFTQDTTEFKEESGLLDEQGKRLVANPESSGRYHSDWLTMMYPRLKLARNLLTDDGVIFISIDDNEQANLKKLCDEVFGEENFRAAISWQKKYSVSNNFKGIASVRDIILSYSKSTNFQNGFLPRSEESTKRYQNPDNDHRGPWKPVDYWNIATVDQRPNCVYPIVNPKTNKEIIPTKKSWKYEKATHEKHVAENMIYWGKDGTNEVPALKLFLSEVRDGLIPHNWWPHTEVSHTDEAKKYLDRLFNGISPFDTPKPLKLIERMLQISSVEKGDVVLDFFAGSASTAEACLKYDKELKYIMVQIPELCAPKSEGEKQGYKNICEIGKERIRRAAKKIQAELEAKQQKDAGKLNFDEDVQTQSLASPPDLGFRVYKLATSNMHDVYYRPQDYSQENLDLFADNLKSDRTPIDLVTQVMLDWGLPLSLKIEESTLAGKTVYKVAGNSLYCCFDNGIDESFAKAVAAEKPLRIVFRDSSFAGDTAKENVKQLLKQLSSETEMKVI